jgi:uncharacterized protein YutE (UPF0331/DUF86 family)
MTDDTVILRKLTSLREHVGRMKRRRPAEAAAFKQDVDVQDAISLSLLVAIQDAVDIALHISAGEGWGIPASYAESFGMLVAHSIIDAELAASLSAMAALRNRIAHGYATVDVERIYHELPEGITALEKFQVAIAKLK